MSLLKKTRNMSKPMKIMLLVVGILFGGIFAYKALGIYMRNKFFASMKDPVVTVSTGKAKYLEWKPTKNSVGTLRAVTGVNVTTQLAGMVEKISFTPGAIVSEGTLLVQLDASTEIGQLESLRAQMELAKITYDRDKKQFKAHAISKQQLDSDMYNLQNLEGQVAAQAATVDKKSIRAPFTGRTGIIVVNPGQYLNPGDTVTTLQSLDPIYADFYLPQQALSKLKLGQTVHIQTDSYPGKTFTGEVTTIQPAIDIATRNVQVEATVSNPDYELKPGMYTNVKVVTGKDQKLLTVPITTISFNPYGDIVYLVQEGGTDSDGKPVLTVKQTFVTVGEAKGDVISIIDGLKEGQTVVTSGQLKLKNGSHITVNNSVEPDSQLNPVVTNDHTR